ncbi:hypothetical protein KHM83_13845 [Fusibacter paucivorans]|uniref:Uncharacterized protein n=1 Tax=Fusibacter paucivorans TaxID=76009 RepID=A0ABS5PUQ1_9FIRM|nr:hypothetical protein [Fusibacter paucivorans]MBS7527762.1 hypothetical protein [Fusibacter paucivorans]
MMKPDNTPTEKSTYKLKRTQSLENDLKSIEQAVFDNQYDLFLELYLIANRYETLFADYIHQCKLNTSFKDLYILREIFASPIKLTPSSTSKDESVSCTDETPHDGATKGGANSIFDLTTINSDALLMDIEDLIAFRKLSKWRHMLVKYKEYLAVMVFSIIYLMDETYGSYNKLALENAVPKDETVIVQPLNTLRRNAYRLYHTSAYSNYNYRLNNRPSAYRGSSLKVILANFNIVELTSDYEVELRVTSDYDLKKLGKLKENETVHIGFSHLASGKFYTSYNESNQFFITGLSDYDCAKSRLFHTLDAMDQDTVDIAIFPEMTCTNALKEAILDEKIESLHHIKLIIFGSIWENRENKSTVITGSGIELYSQSKLNAFHRALDFTLEGCTEGLDLANLPRTIKLLEIPGFGRISNIICVDYLIDEIRDICLSMGVDFFFSPLFTGKIDLFESRAKAMAKEFGTMSVLANVCAYRIADGHSTTGLACSPVLRSHAASTSADDFVYFEANNCFDQCGRINTPKEQYICQHDVCYQVLKFSKKAVQFDQFWQP